MLQSEVYGRYFAAVSAVLAEACAHRLTPTRLRAIVREEAFGESADVIPEALESGRWPLLTGTYCTVLRHPPEMPLTALEKRWMKTVLSDPRAALFDLPEDGLDDVEPLYTQDMFVYFDRCGDADPYTDPGYIRRFRTLLDALREHRDLQVTYRDRHGAVRRIRCRPFRLEYSPKDDKFRLLAGLNGLPITLNLAGLLSCRALDESADERREPPRQKKSAELRLTDRRGALERAMHTFSDLEKETERLDEEGHYRLTLCYDADDETEILIRVLSFGPMLRAVSPPEFAELIRSRLDRQKVCGP